MTNMIDSFKIDKKSSNDEFLLAKESHDWIGRFLDRKLYLQACRKRNLRLEAILEHSHRSIQHRLTTRLNKTESPVVLSNRSSLCDCEYCSLCIRHAWKTGSPICYCSVIFHSNQDEDSANNEEDFGLDQFFNSLSGKSDRKRSLNEEELSPPLLKRSRVYA